MKSYPIYQVDVFTNKHFKGNPAGVCILERPIEDKYMQLIAREMNLSETAFVIPLNNILSKEDRRFSLKWFTPQVEVPLCGHATIGTAKVLFDIIGVKGDQVIFETNSGCLVAKKYESAIGVELPLDKPMDIEIPMNLLEAMGIEKYEKVLIGKNTRKLVVHLNEEKEIINLAPNFEKMKKLNSKYDIKGVAVTTKSRRHYDFISRYFNPWAGVNEDPVTGSVHTLLASYWSSLLGKTELEAYQASHRGGKILLKIKKENRVELVGEAVILLKGELIF